MMMGSLRTKTLLIPRKKRRTTRLGRRNLMRLENREPRRAQGRWQRTRN